jgi:hypothetical protein
MDADVLAGDSAANTALMAQENVVGALLGAFATFSAFGIAAAGFLAAGGVVPTVAAWWSQHGMDEAQRKRRHARRAVKLAGWRSPGLITMAAGTIALLVSISGAGLILSYHWFRDYAGGSAAHMSDTYHWIVRLFTAEVVLLTGTTLVTVAATAWSAWNAQRSAGRSEDAGDEIEKTARHWLAPGKATVKGA